MMCNPFNIFMNSAYIYIWLKISVYIYGGNWSIDSFL